MILEISTVLRAFLMTTSHVVLVPAFVLLYFLYDSAKIARVVYIFLFAIILNSYLKSIWQVPLAPHLGPGWAFPSGHMQAAITLWGWFSLEYNKKWFYAVVPFILCGIATGLIYFGYHSLTDILGAVFFGCLSLLLYFYLLKVWPYRLAFIGALCSIVAALLIVLNPIHFVHLRIVLGLLIGFSLAEFIQDILTLEKENQYLHLRLTTACIASLIIALLAYERQFIEPYFVKHLILYSSLLSLTVVLIPFLFSKILLCWIQPRSFASKGVGHISSLSENPEKLE